MQSDNDCISPSCSRKAKKKDFCEAHYLRMMRGMQTDTPIRHHRSRYDAIIPSCGECQTLRGLCDPHFKQSKRHRLSPTTIATLSERGCAVCGVMRNPNGTVLAIDHDHQCCPGHFSCGRCVRGLLCDWHNRLAGFIEHPDAAAVKNYLAGASHVKD